MLAHQIEVKRVYSIEGIGVEENELGLASELLIAYTNHDK